MALGRTQLIAGIAALAAALGVVVWALVPAERFAYGVAPIARGEAVLLTRRNDDDETRFWTQLVRSDGAVVWATETPGFQTAEALGFSGVVASDERIVLLGQRDGATVVAGLARSDGAPVWETRIAGGEPSYIGNMLLVDGSRVYAVHSDRAGVTALALGDGTILWSSDDADLRELLLFAPDRPVIVPIGAAAVVLDGNTGAVLGPLPLERFACATPDAIVGFADRGVVRLPRNAGADASPERVAIADGVWAGLDGPCGARERDVIVGAETDAPRGIALVRVDPSGGSLRWSLPLGSDLFAAHDSRDGRLPRFLPVVVFGRDGEGALAQRTIIADLDTGTIAAQHEHDDHRMAIVTGERAFVASLFGGTLFAVDPDDGSLERATRFTETVGNEVRAQDVRFGELWLFGMGWGRPDALGWAVVDLDTATTTKVSGDVLATDVTAAGWVGR